MIAYVNTLPLIFVAGLLPVLYVTCVAWLALPRKYHLTPVLGLAAFGYTLTALFLLAGPFVGRTCTESYSMTWELNDRDTDSFHKPEIVLTFVDFPTAWIGIDDNLIAAHLGVKQERVIPVTFDVTYDYGRVRGYSLIMVDGISTWNSTGQVGGTSSGRGSSPFN